MRIYHHVSHHKCRATNMIIANQRHKRFRIHFSICFDTLDNSLWETAIHVKFPSAYYRGVSICSHAKKVLSYTCLYKRRTLKSGSNGSAWSIMQANSSKESFPSRFVSPAMNKASRFCCNNCHSSFTASSEYASTSCTSTT